MTARRTFGPIGDETGFYDATESRDTYELLNERHRAGSIIVTSNRGPDEWLATFADPLRAQSRSTVSSTTPTTSSSTANRTASDRSSYGSCGTSDRALSVSHKATVRRCAAG